MPDENYQRNTGRLYNSAGEEVAEERNWPNSARPEEPKPEIHEQDWQEMVKREEKPPEQSLEQEAIDYQI